MLPCPTRRLQFLKGIESGSSLICNQSRRMILCFWKCAHAEAECLSCLLGPADSQISINWSKSWISLRSFCVVFLSTVDSQVSNPHLLLYSYLLLWNFPFYNTYLGLSCSIHTVRCHFGMQLVWELHYLHIASLSRHYRVFTETKVAVRSPGVISL